MKIRVDRAVKELALGNKRDLAEFLGFSREAATRWNKYLSERACYRLLERRPEFRQKLVEPRE